jgi:hypothetical protein
MGWETLAQHQNKWESLLDEINVGRIKRYPSVIINLTASIVTIAMFLTAAFKSPKPEFWYVILLLCYLGFMTIFLFVQSFRYARKARYADAIRTFHPIAHIFRDAMYNIEDMSESDFALTLQKVLSAFVSGMEIATGTKVRVCIKLLKVEGGIGALEEVDKVRQNELIYAESYVNDPHSSWPEKDYSQYPYDKDRLSCNTAFGSILKGETDYYFENNIPRAYKNHEYENSSFHTYGQGKLGKPGWVLPYRSTILWPIRKLLDKNQGRAHRQTFVEKHDVLGFLCIDSASRNVWSSRYDGQIGASLADFLYAFMNLWFKIHWKSERHPADPIKS